MRWFMSSHSALVAIAGTLIIMLLAGCTTRSDDPSPEASSATLLKGQYVRDASLISYIGKSIVSTTITVGNGAENQLLTNPKFASLQRPTNLGSYSNGSYTGMIDTISLSVLNDKVFTWTPTGRKVVMVAIFNDLIKVAGDTIANPQNIVWLWALPKGEKDPGKVRYRDGYKPHYVNGKFALNTPELLTIKPHVWAVWTWDDKAINIVASSRELPLIIRN